MSSIHDKSTTQKHILTSLCDDQWSNTTCCGYMIFTCENLGYSKEQIKLLLNSMDTIFNNKTVEQAKQKYYSF